MKKNFEDWYNDYGYTIYDSVLDWLQEAPNEIDLSELIGNQSNEEYAFGICEFEYESLLSESIDIAYDDYRDSKLFKED